ncbi:MAG: lipopolysaccharide heptosyltransferase II [Deltaproteobacteria bacterium]
MNKVRGALPIDKSKIRRILVRATNWVGDAVMSMPAFEAVKENFPDSQVAVLARPWVLPLYESHPAATHVIPYTRGNGYRKDFSEFLRVIRTVRSLHFDMAVLFQNAFEAALIARLAGIRIRVGYNTDGRGLLLSHSVARGKEVLKRHQVEYYLTILRALGWDAPTRDPVLRTSPESVSRARSILSSKGIGDQDLLLGLSPGAAYGPAKRWPVERFAAIARRAIREWGARVIVIGTEKERELGETLVSAAAPDVFNFCGMTGLGDALALIKRCRLFVSNDSGLMHVAAALQVPTVAIFGSTDSVATGPRGKNARIVKQDMECSPCLKPECAIGYRCLLAVQPEDVWRSMEELRAQGTGQGSDSLV